MATINNSYGKVDEAENERLMAKRHTRRRLTIIALSSFVLIAIVVSAVVGVSRSNKSKDDNENNSSSSVSSSVKAVCSVTLYPDSCYSSLAPQAKYGHVTPQELFELSVRVAIDELSKASGNFKNYYALGNVTDPNTIAALRSCQQLFDLALDHLNASLIFPGMKAASDIFDDLLTWLSSSQTFVQTCMDDMALVDLNLTAQLQETFKNSAEYSSNSLAIIKSVDDSIDALGAVGKRRGLLMSEGAPRWLSFMDRKLLQASLSNGTAGNNKPSSSSTVKPDAVVAKDGSGKYKTISALRRTCGM